MESKIKGGGGALSRKDLTVTLDPSVNPEKSQRAQSNPKYLKFFNWASSNGVIMPSVITTQVQFPVAYWEEGTIGLGAKIDLPPNKAFLFIPSSLILSPKQAKSSEISEIFSSHPYHFAGHPEADFDILLVFLIYEKSKGPGSKWATYFEAISDLELLVDWSDHELSQLQDPHLVFSVEELNLKIEEKFKNLSEVFEEHSQVFPSGTLLRQTFDWSFRTLSTRAVVFGEIKLVPVADFMNFENRELVFEEFDADVLSQRAGVVEKDADFRDFLGSPVKGSGKEVVRYKSRLDRFLLEKKEGFKGMKTVWELERALDDFESSDDEEEVFIVDFADDDEDVEEENHVSGDYLVISTDAYTGIKQGSQIFNQIKILSNRDWLLQYGISLENNWFESYYLFFWANNMGRVGPLSIQDIKEKSYKSDFPNASLSDVTELIILKSSILNLDLLKYFRKNLDYNSLNLTEPTLKVSPSNINVELSVVEAVLALLSELESKGTPVAQDLNLLHRNLPRRLKFAVIYRVGQKKILAKQNAMLHQLKAILMGLKEGGSIENHMAGKTLKEIKNIYPLRKYLRSLYANLKNEASR
jgi:hypothetical protein